MAKSISETAFASQVEGLLKLYHWRWTHFRPAWSTKGYRTPIKGDKGFPDYCAVRAPRLIFAELKDQYSKPTPGQQAWLDDLKESIRTIVFDPLIVKGATACLSSLKGLKLGESFEVYLWRPNDINEIMEILK